MQLGTQILFFLLVLVVHPDLVCDIGSLDASMALFIRKILPSSQIIAFEANPRNFELMKENYSLKRNRIEIEKKAVWNRDESLIFYLESVSSSADFLRRGISSTRKRKEGSLGIEEVRVIATRLDSYVEKLENCPNKIALWIDVEGGSYEVIESIKKIRRLVKILHVEVETKEVWIGQKLKPEVEELLEKLGFFLVAHGSNSIQHDLVFVNKSTLFQKKFIINACVVLARLLTFFEKFGAKIFYKVIQS
jgi:FkbM family methyltransferase